jgi:hypothetical protein
MRRRGGAPRRATTGAHLPFPPPVFSSGGCCILRSARPAEEPRWPSREVGRGRHPWDAVRANFDTLTGGQNHAAKPPLRAPARPFRGGGGRRGGPGGRSQPEPGRGRRGRSRRHRLPLAGPRPRAPPGPGRRRRGRLARDASAAGAAAPCPLAPGLPAVRGGRRGADDLGPASSFLALLALAFVPLGELAAAGTGRLPPLRGPSLLVPQPREHRLPRLRIPRASI